MSTSEESHRVFLGRVILQNGIKDEHISCGKQPALYKAGSGIWLWGRARLVFLGGGVGGGSTMSSRYLHYVIYWTFALFCPS